MAAAIPPTAAPAAAPAPAPAPAAPPDAPPPALPADEPLDPLSWAARGSATIVDIATLAINFSFI